MLDVTTGSYKLKTKKTKAKPNASFEPGRYRAVKQAAIRTGFDRMSERIGAVASGSVIEVLETRFDGQSGQMRVRLNEGWTSTHSRHGTKLLQPVDPGTPLTPNNGMEKTKAKPSASFEEEIRPGRYRAVKQAAIRTGFDHGFDRMSDRIGAVASGSVIEVLETRFDGQSGQMRVRLNEGWTSTHSRHGTKLLQPVDPGTPLTPNNGMVAGSQTTTTTTTKSCYLDKPCYLVFLMILGIRLYTIFSH